MTLLLLLGDALLLAWLVWAIFVFFKESALCKMGGGGSICVDESLAGRLMVSVLVPPFDVLWFLDELHRRWKLCPQLEAKLRARE